MFIAVCPFIGIGLTPPYRAMEGETSVMHNQFLCVFSFCEIYASALIHLDSITTNIFFAFSSLSSG